MPTESFNHSSEPTSLLHCLQGWPPDGPNHFRWQQGRLVYMLPDRAIDPRSWDKFVMPTQSQWQQLWSVCDEIDVWAWPPTLGDLDVCDGLQWVMELEMGSRRVASRGQVYGSPPDFGARLMRLHRQLQAMVGWNAPNSQEAQLGFSGGFMDREVFILPSGESVLTWELRFGRPQDHDEIVQATQHESDGSSSRTGKVYFIVETKEVRFCTCPGSLAVGQKGQLSSKGDQFFDVVISAIDPVGDHDLITAHASRNVGVKVEPDR